MIRRTALDDVGYFDETLERNEEIQLLAFLTYKYKMKLLNEYLAFVDSSESPNQPSAEKMARIKEVYFKSIAPILDQLSPQKKKQVIIMNTFEIGLLMIRTGKNLRA